ncbi:hypothetical protein G6O69_21885 [Pseudenhygromyxa sp. WMMC2535]|uniref:hypothetical protein n=1 Tax=Pseudenhygromyxa sp. WMMC2535 TaxID=2712867 RepID=UPI0015547796|nr:hypothetical protein [Pseudenhygromyxa sp. WMMC2535]NVB40507.1 hypothetical protein [Pseudenhygromyxa sp. WMMC2535]
MNRAFDGQPNQPSAPPIYGMGAPSEAPRAPHYGHAAPPLYGAAQGHQPSAGLPPYAQLDPTSAELRELSDQSNTWLLVVAIGFWLGFGLLTGPLGWYFGARMRSKYRALGHHPCAAANWAWGLGIASSLLSLFAILALVAFIAFIAAGLPLY